LASGEKAAVEFEHALMSLDRFAAEIVKLYGGEIKAYNDEGACFEFAIRDLSE